MAKHDEKKDKKRNSDLEPEGSNHRTTASNLQQEAESWLSLGTTKTGMVYRLKGNAAQSHE